MGFWYICVMIGLSETVWESIVTCSRANAVTTEIAPKDTETTSAVGPTQTKNRAHGQCKHWIRIACACVFGVVCMRRDKTWFV